MSAQTHDHQHSAEVSGRVKTLIAQLETAGITSQRQVDDVVQSFLEKARPENGYRAVARAWSDSEFKRRLLQDANAAVEELGIDLSHWAPVKLRVVENTQSVHNLIVCTLCSCYPIALLGPSPSWYKSEAYRARAVSEPRAVLQEFGLKIPQDTRIVVWDSTAEARYMVLPMRPAQTDGMSEAELAALVTRNGLIGTAAV